MYDYHETRPELFTERGAETLLKVRDNVQRIIREGGAVRAQESWKGVDGDSWLMLAALDYLVERDEIREVTNGAPAAQHRVFVAGQRKP